MICFSREFLFQRRLRKISLNRPTSMILITGAEKERINAVFDRNEHIVQLIVHTKQKNIH